MTNALLETTIAMSTRHVLQMEIYSHAIVTMDSVAMESAAKTKTNAAMEVITVILNPPVKMNLEASNVNVHTDILVMVTAVSTMMNAELQITIVTNKLVVSTK